MTAYLEIGKLKKKKKKKLMGKEEGKLQNFSSISPRNIWKCCSARWEKYLRIIKIIIKTILYFAI